MLRNLEVITVYEVRVARKQADGSYGPYSSSALFQTLSAKAQQCVAEAVETTQELASMSQQPLLMLQTGERFLAGGGMEVTVVNAQGGNGVFSGTGVVLIPWLGTRLEVVFQEVIINEDKQLVGGAVELRSDSNVKELLAEIDKKTQKKKRKTKERTPEAGAVAEPVVVAGTIDQVSVDEENQQVSVQIAGQAEPVLVSYAEGPVTIQDEAGNRYVVNEQGEVTDPDSALASTTEPTGETTTVDSLLSIKEQLIQEVLTHFQQEINLWLDNQEKGPLDRQVINRLLTLPDCLPQEEEQLQQVWDRIEYFESHIEELITLIEQDELVKERFEFLIKKLNGKQPPYREELTEGEWDELLGIVCPYIVPREDAISGLSKNIKVVTFNSVPNSYKLKEGRLEFTYTLADTLALNYSKFEVFKLENNGDTTLVEIYPSLASGKEVSFVDTKDKSSIGWSGKGSDGNYVKPGNYLVTITATVDSDYTSGFRESRDLTIEPFDTSVTDDIDFIGYSSSDPTGCFRRASEMLESAGYRTVAPDHTNVVQMTQADNNDSLQVQDNILDGIDLINEYLDNNIPVMVGVDYHDGHPGNSDETTDHWLIIVGRTTTNNQTCYRYYDAQTAHVSIGTSIDNELCEQDNHTLTDTYREGTNYERTYTVTMVRPSEEINN